MYPESMELNDKIINLVGNIELTNPDWRDTLCMDILSLILEVRA